MKRGRKGCECQLIEKTHLEKETDGPEEEIQNEEERWRRRERSVTSKTHRH